MTNIDPVIVEALEEYIGEWQQTCRQMRIPFTAHDAAAFVAEGDLRNLIADALRTVEAERDAALAEVARLRAAVEALAEKWRYKGEFGWGAWQEGHGPDIEGQILDDAATALRRALTEGGTP